MPLNTKIDIQGSTYELQVQQVKVIVPAVTWSYMGIPYHQRVRNGSIGCRCCHGLYGRFGAAVDSYSSAVTTSIAKLTYPSQPITIL